MSNTTYLQASKVQYTCNIVAEVILDDKDSAYAVTSGSIECWKASRRHSDS